MAQLSDIRVSVETTVVLTLNEYELAALDALAGYGVDAFLRVFYEHLGKAYLQPYERGLRSLLETVNGCRSLNGEAEECRKFLAQSRAARLTEGRR